MNDRQDWRRLCRQRLAAHQAASQADAAATGGCTLADEPEPGEPAAVGLPAASAAPAGMPASADAQAAASTRATTPELPAVTEPAGAGVQATDMVAASASEADASVGGGAVQPELELRQELQEQQQGQEQQQQEQQQQAQQGQQLQGQAEVQETPAMPLVRVGAESRESCLPAPSLPSAQHMGKQPMGLLPGEVSASRSTTIDAASDTDSPTARWDQQLEASSQPPTAQAADGSLTPAAAATTAAAATAAAAVTPAAAHASPAVPATAAQPPNAAVAGELALVDSTAARTPPPPPGAVPAAMSVEGHQPEPEPAQPAAAVHHPGEAVHTSWHGMVQFGDSEEEQRGGGTSTDVPMCGIWLRPDGTSGWHSLLIPGCRCAMCCPTPARPSAPPARLPTACYLLIAACRLVPSASVICLLQLLHSLQRSNADEGN